MIAYFLLGYLACSGVAIMLALMLFNGARINDPTRKRRSAELQEVANCRESGQRAADQLRKVTTV